MKYLIILMLIVCSVASQAQTEQDSTHKNFTFFEAFGSSLAYSLNYERVIIDRKKLNISVRAGFMILPPLVTDVEGVTLGFPTGVNFAFGNNVKSFVIGTGYTNITDIATGGMDADPAEFPKYDFIHYAYLKAAYRKIHPNDVYFEIGLLSFYDIGISEFIPPAWIGISIGYAF